MQRKAIPMSQRPPWYLWPLAPLAFLGSLIVMLPLGVLALVSIPVVWLYPDRHMHVHDLRGSAEEKRRLARWRREYNRLSFFGRVRRSIRRSICQRRRAA